MAQSDYSAEYITAAEGDSLDSNVYIDIEGIDEFFAIKPVVGLGGTVLEVLKDPKFSGGDIDINSPKTPLNSITFTLLDLNNVVSEAFREKDIHEKTVKVFVSPDASLDFSKYAIKAEYRLKDISARDGNDFQIKCIQTGELLLERLIIGDSSLLDDIDDTQITDIKVIDTDEFTGSGTRKVYIGAERISFTGIDSSNELTGVVRGVDSTTAEDHSAGDEVEIFRSIIGENIIDIMLQLIISSGGGGTYDVLDFGMGIRQELVDIAEFENVRDTTGYISTQSGDIELRGDEDNFLEFIEQNFLEPSGLRLWYRDNGIISLLVLAEPQPVQGESILEDEMINGRMPLWRSNSRRIINILKIKLNFDISKKRFSRELIFTDNNSIAKYGKKKVKEIKTRALQTGNGALSFLTSFSNKYLSFYSTPAPSLDKVSLQANQQYFDAGNVVNISHSSLPNLITGSRGVIADSVQILGKKFDFKDSTSEYNLFYARLLNIRIGFIAPTGTVKAGSWSTSVFELITADNNKFKAGDKVALWNSTNASPPVNFDQSTITAVDGDEITVSPAFSTVPVENYRLRYDKYDVVQDSQKVYAFIGKSPIGDFDDGVGPYKIGA